VIELTVFSEAATNRCSVSQLQDMVQYFGTDILYTRQVQYAHFLRDATPSRYRLRVIIRGHRMRRCWVLSRGVACGSHITARVAGVCRERY